MFERTCKNCIQEKTCKSTDRRAEKCLGFYPMSDKPKEKKPTRKKK